MGKGGMGKEEGIIIQQAGVADESVNEGELQRIKARTLRKEVGLQRKIDKQPDSRCRRYWRETQEKVVVSGVWWLWITRAVLGFGLAARCRPTGTVDSKHWAMRCSGRATNGEAR